MINAPQAVIDALKADSVRYANLVTVNLGDAYGDGNDVLLYLTDTGGNISFGGHTYIFDNVLTGIAGISRKASTGSDKVDIEFSITDETLLDSIRAQRYANKPTSIERVLLDENGAVIAGYAIPIRTAWGLSHQIDGDIEDRTVTLTIDSSLGDLDGDNGWYALNSSHQKRQPNDLVMQHSGTVMTEDQQKKYTTTFSGVISQENKPPALPRIYGYKNVKAVPVAMLKHRKTHTSYRHYFTTLIYVLNIGDCEEVDIVNIKKGGDDFDVNIVDDTSVDVGGWSCRVRTPSENNASIETDTKLNFWREGMDSNERARIREMYGKGLTLLFVKNRNRDDWLNSAPEITVPLKGAKVYDPRSGLTAYSRNPALQYADFLRSTDFGAGGRGISVDDTNIAELADHFDLIPESLGNDGINSILIDVQLDTGAPIVDNMNIWMEGVRLFTSDYYGEFSIRVETISPIVAHFDENDLLDFPEFESGDFTDRINQLTYSIKQMVPDPDGEEYYSPLIGEWVPLLIEVDVEATFPESDSATHTQWLDEDSGIQNFESEALDYVTVLEQAYYWAMVDARISRQPRTMEISVGTQGWLLETGDVITFTSEILGVTDQEWRIEEVTEDDEDTTLALIAYDADFYTPDPDSVPDPIPYAKTPSREQILPVNNLRLDFLGGNYYLNWDAQEFADWYAVSVTGDSTGTIVDDGMISSPPYLMPAMNADSFTAEVLTIFKGTESTASSIPFDITLPKKPTSATMEAGDKHVNIIPLVANQAHGVTYSFYLRGTSASGTRILKAQGTQNGYIGGLLPETTYYFSVKAVNAIGESDFYEASTVTTALSAGGEGKAGVNGAGIYIAYVATVGDIPDDTGKSENLAELAGRVVVDNDVLRYQNLQSNQDKATWFRKDYIFNGSTWDFEPNVVDGSLIVDNTIAASAVVADSISAREIKSDIILGEDATFLGTVKIGGSGGTNVDEYVDQQAAAAQTAAESYTKQQSLNLMDTQGWAVGNDTTDIPDIGDYSTATTNGISSLVAPLGDKAPVLWYQANATTSDWGGGMACSLRKAIRDNTTSYRFTAWVRANHNRHIYCGFNTSGGIQNLTGSGNNNPYFISGWTGNVIDEWYLVVGVLHGSSVTDSASIAGIYSAATGKRIAEGAEYRVASTFTGDIYARAAQYSVNIGDRIEFYNPVWSRLDEAVPIESILAQGVANSAEQAAKEYADTNDKADGSVAGWTIDSTDMYSGSSKSIGTDGYKASNGIVMNANGSIKSKNIQINTDGSVKTRADITGSTGTFNGILEMNALRVRTVGNKVAPVTINEFLQKPDNNSSAAITLQFPAFYGQGSTVAGEQEKFHPLRTGHNRQDFKVRLDMVTRSDKKGTLTIEVFIGYNGSMPSYRTHEYSVTPLTASGEFGTVPFMFRYTSRDAAWDSLSIKVVAKSPTNEDYPIHVLAEITTMNFNPSGYTQNSFSGEQIDMGDIIPPDIPQGGHIP